MSYQVPLTIQRNMNVATTLGAHGVVGWLDRPRFFYEQLFRRSVAPIGDAPVPFASLAARQGWLPAAKPFPINLFGAREGLQPIGGTPIAFPLLGAWPGPMPLPRLDPALLLLLRALWILPTTDDGVVPVVPPTVVGGIRRRRRKPDWTQVAELAQELAGPDAIPTMAQHEQALVLYLLLSGDL